jgi:ketosteroid isomerase-like protein
VFLAFTAVVLSAVGGRAQPAGAVPGGGGKIAFVSERDGNASSDPGQTQPAPTYAADEAQMAALDRAWADALVNNDLDALDRFYADDLVYTHSTGGVETKAEMIDSLRTRARKYQAARIGEIKVRLHARTAVVTGTLAVNVDNRGRILDATVRYIHVWVREDARWRLVAHQTTVMTDVVRRP